LLQWTVGLLALPTLLYVVAALAWTVAVGSPDTAQANGDAGMPPFILSIFEAAGTGGLKDAFIANLVFLAGRWADLFATMRFPKVLGMFVLGLYAVRVGIALNPSAHRKMLLRWCIAGWVIGLPANVVAAWASERWEYLPPSAGGTLGVIMQAIGFPMLAIGYATTIALLVVSGVRIINVFGPVGRMALTNYLMHSVVCVILAYGFGFGLWWRIGASTAMVIAAAVVVVQLPVSAWWMSRHRFGPAEWVWRRFTYGRAAV
jgi:uncharacterized protein